MLEQIIKKAEMSKNIYNNWEKNYTQFGSTSIGIAALLRKFVRFRICKFSANYRNWQKNSYLKICIMNYIYINVNVLH